MSRVQVGASDYRRAASRDNLICINSSSLPLSLTHLLRPTSECTTATLKGSSNIDDSPSTSDVIPEYPYLTAPREISSWRPVTTGNATCHTALTLNDCVHSSHGRNLHRYPARLPWCSPVAEDRENLVRIPKRVEWIRCSPHTVMRRNRCC